MRFDDRLLTVLNQPAGDRHDAAVRWRQLVDLVARAGQNGVSQLIGVALDAIRDSAPRVDESVRAAAARSIAAFPLPLGLIEYFAGERLSISAPILAAATLDEGQWSALLAAADEETAAFIRTLHPDLAPALVSDAPSPPARQSEFEPIAQAAGEYKPPSLHEVVERIERRRRLRAEQSIEAGQAQPSIDQPAALFRWECGPGGDIVWVDGVPRAALIGRSLARAQERDRDRLDPAVARAFAMRGPFRDAPLALGGPAPVAGDWKISGVPAFEPASGRFAGYRGVALRQEAAPATTDPQVLPEVLADPDSLRELMHEIKTPLNAIIGFAEIIEGQYLGPAEQGYRARAGEIFRQGHKLLTAIDDLDFAAKVRSATRGAHERVDLSKLVERAANELKDITARLSLEIDLVPSRIEAVATVQPELADRLLVRLFGALVEHAVGGERLSLTVRALQGSSRIAVSRPSSLRSLGDEGLFGADMNPATALDKFSLRLVRGLARISGGDLVTGGDDVELVFPSA